MRSVNVLIERWRREGTVVLPPISAEHVRETFAALGSVATADVVALYGLLGGMENPDDAVWRPWPLAEVRAQKLNRSAYGVLFSDYMVDCWGYRLRPRDNETSAVLIDRFGEHEPAVVAHSLSAFFDAYVADADVLLNAVDDKY
jgi:hypothetical protein